MVWHEKAGQNAEQAVLRVQYKHLQILHMGSFNSKKNMPRLPVIAILNYTSLNKYTSRTILSKPYCSNCALHASETFQMCRGCS